MPTSTPLWRLDEALDLFLDSYAADDSSAVFLSLWGRDTAVHELLAKLTLSVAAGARSRCGELTRRCELWNLVLKKTDYGQSISLWRPGCHSRALCQW